MVVTNQAFSVYELILQFLGYYHILGLLCDNLLFCGTELVFKLDDDFLGLCGLSLNEFTELVFQMFVFSFPFLKLCVQVDCDLFFFVKGLG